MKIEPNLTTEDEAAVCAECSAEFLPFVGHECHPRWREARLDGRRADLRRSGVPSRYAEAITETLDVPPFPAITPRRPWIVIVGPPGTGKTYRACELLLARFVQQKGRKGERFVPWPDFILERKLAMGNPDLEDPIHDLLGLKSLVVLDDIGAERPTEYAIETLNLVLGRRYNEATPTILTSNLTSERIEEIYGERIGSRIAESATFLAELGDDRRRAA